MSDVFDKHEYVIGQACGGRLDSICLDYNGDIEETIVDLNAERLTQLATIRELQARIAELEEVERKAIAQSEYIQSHGLTEYEMARLKAWVAELESHIAATDPWKEAKT